MAKRKRKQFLSLVNYFYKSESQRETGPLCAGEVDAPKSTGGSLARLHAEPREAHLLVGLLAFALVPYSKLFEVNVAAVVGVDGTERVVYLRASLECKSCDNIIKPPEKSGGGGKQEPMEGAN